MTDGKHLKPRFVGDTELPYNEQGNLTGPVIRADEVDPVGRPANWTLTGLAAAHRLFHPGLIRAAGMVTDPVALCWAENNLPHQSEPYVVDLGWAAFTGLPVPENHTLLACPLEHARILIPALSRVRFGTPEASQWDVIHQRLDLVDLRLLKTLTHQPPEPPTVPVDLFGLTGPTGTYLWKPPTDPWTQGPRLMFRSAAKPNQRKPFSR